MSTVRELVDMLIETATGLPAGMDSEVEIAVCDSTTMTVANNVDVSDWAELNTADGTARRTFVIHTTPVAAGRAAPRGAALPAPPDRSGASYSRAR
ncbi:hypothetical protein [Tenggerimyces flavus]|uniref:Uncharacterized protein n=1 Tax=Tenggerimyces flavus TaxID=1708749 RepID=A0ABV7Y3D1_9ACTN|nr:hypothetical protein [Tenggerimyces flavus]MBM7790317.1 hypothetical protein [Tenggerimyces flavus]